MKVTVFGATGAIGTLAIGDLLDAGHEVTAYARTPSKVPTTWGDRVRVVVGEITDPDQVATAVDGADAVISLMGPPMKKIDGTPLTDGMRVIVNAMNTAGVRRFVGIATPTVLAPEDRRSIGARIFYGLAGRMAGDLVGMVDIATAADLDWTIVRFLLPTDDAKQGIARAGFVGGKPKVTMKASRADIAQFVVDQLADHTWLHKMPQISN